MFAEQSNSHFDSLGITLFINKLLLIKSVIVTGNIYVGFKPLTTSDFKLLLKKIRNWYNFQDQEDDKHCVVTGDNPRRKP